MVRFGLSLGKLLGGVAGKHLGKLIGKESEGENFGQQLGEYGSKFLPFKKGGRVRGKRSQAVPILAHGGEYILPASVKPTKAQMKAVNALHKPKKPRATRAKKAKK